MKSIFALFLVLFTSPSFGLGQLLSGGSGNSNFVPTSSEGYGVGRARGYLGASCERGSDPYLCMMCNCIRESSGEPLEGKKLVGLVVKSRVESANWENSICGVIYEPYQFSWTLEDRGLRPLPSQMTKDMIECQMATDATINAPGNGMDHYHADYVSPAWARTCQRTTKVGRHIFYKNCGSKPLKNKNRSRMGKIKSKARK